MTTHHPPQDCPQCGYTFDAASPVEGGDRTPGEGDLSLCLNCGAALTLDSGRWRLFAAAEIAGLDPRERAELERAQRAHRKARAAGDLPDLRRGGHG